MIYNIFHSSSNLESEANHESHLKGEFSDILHSEKCRELTLVMIFAQNEPENSRNSPYR